MQSNEVAYRVMKAKGKSKSTNGINDRLILNDRV
jgi:hypothetical protein